LHLTLKLRKPVAEWNMYLDEYQMLVKNGKQSCPAVFFDQRLISLFDENGHFPAVVCWMRSCRAMRCVNWEKIRNPKGYMHNNFSIWRMQVWPTKYYANNIPHTCNP